jgi:outer membrane biosynthesis protein TonB
MKTILVAFILTFLLTGCETSPSAPAKTAQLPPWSLPPFPSTLPPLEVKRHFGLPPPHYPHEERRGGIRGEVLLAIVVDENQRLAKWTLVRATTEGFALSVLKTMSKQGRAPGVPPGEYLYSVVFNGDSQDIDTTRPATFWITTELLGRP